jgi:hypothetical protein
MNGESMQSIVIDAIVRRAQDLHCHVQRYAQGRDWGGRYSVYLMHQYHTHDACNRPFELSCYIDGNEVKLTKIGPIVEAHMPINHPDVIEMMAQRIAVAMRELERALRLERLDQEARIALRRRP